MTERNYSPEEIQDLTDRVFLLKESLESGKMKIASHLIEGFQRSYEQIRLDADGKVDPTTVDGRIRSSTLALVAMKQREEAKKAFSLAEIQNIYFDFLFKELGWIFEKMKKEEATPAQAARVFSRDETFVSSMSRALPDFADALREFWLATSDPASYHLQDSNTLKANFAGDLFPAYHENVVSSAGLYVDTIIVPCPVMRIAPLLHFMEPKRVVEFFLKHVLTAMGYRDLAVAEVSPPIVQVVPKSSDIAQSDKAALLNSTELLQCAHANYLFGRTFESTQQLLDFCGELKSIDQVMAELKGKDRLLFDAEDARDPRLQLAGAMKNQLELPPGLDPANAGHHVFMSCVGRMPQAFDAQQNAIRLGSTPLINAETSWLYYTWLLQYQSDGKHSDKGDETMHIVRAMQSERSKNLEWLGNVPTETILSIRRQGLALDVREILGKGVSDLISINPHNFHRSADQVVANLEAAFKVHQQQLSEAKLKKLKLFGIDVMSCLTVGGIAVAAAFTSNPTLGAVSGLLGIAGLPSLRDISTKLKAVVEEDRARQQSPTGLLFKHLP